MESFSASMNSARLQAHTKNLFDNPLFSDFTVQCTHGGSFRCHRAILASDPYFAKMLQSGMAESQTSTTTLPESKVVVEIILKDIYGHPFPTNTATTLAISVYIAAEKYMMNILKMKAKDAINSTIAKGSANRAQILAGVKRVYRSTREGDELRELFVSWAAGCRQGMAKDEVAKRELEAVFGEVPRFAVDLFLRGGGQHRA